MLVRLKTLNLIFAEKKDQKRLASDGRCCDCGHPVSIGITRTSGGFGMDGGVLYEPRPGQIVSKCPDCYRRKPQLALRSSTAGHFTAFTLHKFS
jgi:hypothetical protein